MCAPVVAYTSVYLCLPTGKYCRKEEREIVRNWHWKCGGGAGCKLPFKYRGQSRLPSLGDM